jgi:hypothetical protein
MRLILLLLVVFQCSALMYRSASAIAHWDTWGYYDGAAQKYWAFALVTEVSPGEGFVAASSTDGIHWHDHGYVFHKPGSYPYPQNNFVNQSCPGSTVPDGSPAVCSGWQVC